ncbi:TPA: hypothetical protein N0F65_007196 [Lagenidium giganteum]|uniref:1-phosphatidylinositol-3-phosphate 5-kinase n=1 Tax=Lagenidium giganteum TaxID=4803 RepID=A0AAV2Z6N9_9STRA|nr:TPA: hypothetical protein N0F65_007196 [Lagenidium giganteum]
MATAPAHPPVTMADAAASAERDPPTVAPAATAQVAAAASPVRAVTPAGSHQHIDRDPSRLTTFPVPGFFSSTLQFVRDSTSPAPDVAEDVAPPTQQAPAMATQYWMPDHLCKVEHHCRLCGQIFCYECSDHFIDGEQHGFMGQIRICNFCWRFINSSDQKKNLVATDTNGDEPCSPESSACGRDSDVFKTSVSPVSMSPMLTSSQEQTQDCEVIALAPLPLDESEDTVRGPPQLFTIHSSESVDFDDELVRGDQKKFRSKQAVPPRRRRSSTELMGAIERSSSLPDDAGALSTIPSRRRSSLKAEPSFRLVDENRTTGEAILEQHMKAAHAAISTFVTKSISQTEWDDIYTSEADQKRLHRELEDLAFVVTGHLLFSMKYRYASGFNHTRLVKVKSIATTRLERKTNGFHYSFKWMAGTICRKSLSHKQMARQVQNPRILLFACGISYDRSFDSERLSSLDTLLEQEKSYMAILVEKISALQPDVIFVGRTVSRPAQELLRERGIAIVLNVKEEMLERISRHTGAAILKTVEHVDKLLPSMVVGTCRLFEAKSLPVVHEDDPRQESPPKPTLAGRVRTETYLHIDGCDPLNGCTIVVTGPSKVQLRLMKRLVRDIIFRSYRLLLEAHVLGDLYFPVSVGRDRNEVSDTCCTTCVLRLQDQLNTKQRFVQCSGSKQITLTAYSNSDISFGSFLTREMQSLTRKCQTFSCTRGTVIISFEELPDQSFIADINISGSNETDPASRENELRELGAINTPEEANCTSAPTITFWRWCQHCKSVVTPFTRLQKYLHKFSVARFLQILFAEDVEAQTNRIAGVTCEHQSLEAHVLFFNLGSSVARLDFLRRTPVGIARDDRSLHRSLEAKELVNSSRDVLKEAASTRIRSMTKLLAELAEIFSVKVHGVKNVIESVNADDTLLHSRVLLEVMCLHKLIQGDQIAYSKRLEALRPDACNSLVECDSTKRDMYHLACRWIDRLLKLRKLIKNDLSRGSTNIATPPMKTGVFTFNTSTQNTPTSLSPVRSPSANDQQPNFAVEEVGRRLTSSDGENVTASLLESSIYSVLSSSAVDAPKKLPTPSHLSVDKNIDKEPMSAWRVALSELYRVLGRSASDSDYKVDLPPELISGHPSLPTRSGEACILVYDQLPVTFAAYALSSDAYVEESDSWKVMVHHEVAATVTSSSSEQNATPVSTNWTRSVLTTPSLTSHFKYATTETPLHLSLLASSSVSTAAVESAWEFQCIAFHPLQFEVLRELFCYSHRDFLFSISHAKNWEASGGKSGASFHLTLDDRFVVKHISFTELQSFLDVLPAYFKYMAGVYFDGEPSFLAKTVGLYQVTTVCKTSGVRTVTYIAVMENVFHNKHIDQVYDLKGSSRNRFVKPSEQAGSVLLDGNYLEFTEGHPLGILVDDHSRLVTAIKNDTSFLCSINIVDYSMVAGFGRAPSEERSDKSSDATSTKDQYSHMTVGIIDYLRQFDFMKRVESVSKSVGMIAGQASPTIIEPNQYAKRFLEATHRYFMPVAPISSPQVANM